MTAPSLRLRNPLSRLMTAKGLRPSKSPVEADDSSELEADESPVKANDS
jgi:hypothetical protein